MILLIGGEKGGSGKSTVACNLAAYLAHKGKDVLLVDADPQKTSATWATRRNESYNDMPKINIAEKTGDIYEAINDWSTRYEEIIIDTGGRDSKELRSGLMVANSLYIPIKPSQVDIDTLGKMNDLAKQAQAMNRGLTCTAMINQAPTNPNMADVKETQAILSELPEFKKSIAVLRYRSSYWRTMGVGLSLVEYEDIKAKNEIVALGEEVFA